MKKYNLTLTDEYGKVVLNLKDVSVKCSSYSVEQPSENAPIKVDAVVSGLLHNEQVDGFAE